MIALAPAPFEWMPLAACRDADPELFFPVAPADPVAEKALRICEGCEVRPECLDFARSTGQADGIWGGTTEDERRNAAQRERARRFRERRAALCASVITVSTPSPSALARLGRS